MSNLSLVFTFQGNNVVIQCQESDKIEEVFNKYCFKAGLEPNDLKFYYNGKEVRRCGKTLFALGISKNGKFDVVSTTHLLGA